MRPFRELEVWQAAHASALDIYKASAGFPRTEQYGLTSPLRRAALSIAANIAEGSVFGGPEFGRYLRIALGSAAETEYLLLLARDLGYLDDQTHRTLESRVKRIERMLVSFLSALRRQAERREPRADGRQPAPNEQQPTTRRHAAP